MLNVEKDVDLTSSFCCNFEFRRLVLQRGWVWGAQHKITKKKPATLHSFSYHSHTQYCAQQSTVIPIVFLYSVPSGITDGQRLRYTGLYMQVVSC